MSIQEGDHKGLQAQLGQAQEEIRRLLAELTASQALSASSERLQQRCMAADEATAAARADIHQKVSSQDSWCPM